MRGGLGGRLGSGSVRSTTAAAVREQNRCQVEPTILFACPAKIPRSSLRSFSLWTRHSAETSAELNVRLGAAEFFPVASRQVRQVRKRRREGNARAAQGTTRVESRYTIQTGDPSVSRTAVRWAHNSSSSAPPRSPAPSFAHFPFGPRPCLYHDDGDKLCQYEIILACGLDSRLNNTT